MSTAVGSTEMLATLYQTAWHHNLKDGDLCSHHWENLKSCQVMILEQLNLDVSQLLWLFTIDHRLSLIELQIKIE
jgi:hypothetical protein